MYRYMVIYKNLGGNSNIKAYLCGEDYIVVRFFDDSVYTYTYESAGELYIELMKKLANFGKGLNGFINKFVKYKYAKKEKF